MKAAFISRAGAVALAAVLPFATAMAGEMHSKFTPDALQWTAAPASLPQGAEMAVLMGDPSAEGQFALRFRVPDGYHVPPHTHPALENVTVISGSFHLGTGESADPAAAQVLPAGSFVSMPPGMVHYVFTEGETVIQLNSVGPWGIEYVDPTTDPRKAN